MNLPPTEQSLETIKREILSLTNSNALPSQSLTDLKQMDQLVEKILSDYHNSSRSSNNVEEAEVLYDFQPQQQGDLQLKRGDKITILEKLSQDWFKGKTAAGDEGVFPANYVKIMDANKQMNRAQPPPPPSYSSTSNLSNTSSNNNSSYYQQPLQQQQNYSQQVPPFPPASTNYYQQQQPVQQQQQPVQQQQQQQQQNKPSKLGQIGSQLGNAFVFGAGATLGGDLVNSIF